MASLRPSTLLPQCTSCLRRLARQNLDAWSPQQTRALSKKAKEAERNIVVKLLKDVPKFGRAGTEITMLGASTSFASFWRTEAIEVASILRHLC